jgi:2-methylcitrate dehydratase PrpD
MKHSENTANSSIIEAVSDYIVSSHSATLPEEIIESAKHHILDTLAATISGAILKPGRLARKFAVSQAGPQEALVAGTRRGTSAINAALANAMMAHADETDDSHPVSNTHPGCGIVPAALAVAEKEGATGLDWLKGVVAGYDIGCRMTPALGVDVLHRMHRATHSVGNCFGAAAAAASVAQLKPEQVRYVLSYAAQQTAGVNYWARDREHVEKSLVFAGLPARNGVTATIMVQSGFTGVDDPFSGDDNFLDAFSPDPQPQLLTRELGKRYEVIFTNIKKYPVGSPIQAPLEALLNIIKKFRIKPDDVNSLTARLPEVSLRIVNGRDMPDVNLQYILAVTLLEGRLTFAAAHSYERMFGRAIKEIETKISTISDPELSSAKATRQGIIELTLHDGTRLREHVVSVRGVPENPMTRAELTEKGELLLTPVIGKDRTGELIKTIWNLEKVNNVRELRPLIAGPYADFRPSRRPS